MPVMCNSSFPLSSCCQGNKWVRRECFVLAAFGFSHSCTQCRRQSQLKKCIFPLQQKCRDLRKFYVPVKVYLKFMPYRKHKWLKIQGLRMTCLFNWESLHYLTLHTCETQTYRDITMADTNQAKQWANNICCACTCANDLTRQKRSGSSFSWSQ